MKDKLFTAPIPGQSLTDTPKNYPWERPAELSSPREAIQYHLEGINSPDALDNILQLIQIGVPIKPLAETILTQAQMEGMHTVDVSLVIKDVLTEELVSIAEEAGLDYKMGDEPSELDRKETEDEAIAAMVRKQIDAMAGTDEDDAGVDLMRQTADALEGGAPEMQEEPVQEEEQMMPEPQEQPVARGLMARG